MFRVFNPRNLDEHVDVESFPQAFDPRKWDWRPDGTNLTPKQYFDWLKATVDTNWEEWVTYRATRNTAYPLDQVHLTNEYHILKNLFADRPKWWSEFITLNFDSASGFYLRYCLPEPAGTSLEYYNSHQSLKIPARFETDYATDYATQNRTVDYNHEKITDFFTRFGEALSLYLENGGSLNRGKSAEALNNNSCFTMSHRFLWRILTDLLTIKHIDARGRANHITPSTMCSILSTNDKAMLSIKLDGGNEWFVNIKEPRAPATREQLSTILNYTTNVLDYLPFNIRSKTEPKAPLYGVELEACSDYSPKQVIAAQSELFFICKSDGTISGVGEHKYELVTVPATFKAHKRLWADWFSKLDYTKFDTSKNTGNGMHVHIERAAFFDPKHINRFVWFITNPANFEFMFELSERPNKNEFQRWAPMPHYTTTRSRTMSMRMASQVNRNLRGAVHFKGDKTIEVRMFKGVVSYATILKNLEFVDSVFEFTSNTSLQQIKLPTYLAWLKSLPANRYTALREFIAQLKLENILLSSELKDYLFNITAPEQILAKLNKAPFQITNKHITAINREKRKRTFILNKDGSISLAYSTGGKLAAFDKAYQAKMMRGAHSLSVNSMLS